MWLLFHRAEHLPLAIPLPLLRTAQTPTAARDCPFPCNPLHLTHLDRCLLAPMEMRPVINSHFYLFFLMSKNSSEKKVFLSLTVLESLSITLSWFVLCWSWTTEPFSSCCLKAAEPKKQRKTEEERGKTHAHLSSVLVQSDE